jgi:hypothetical protein
MLQNHIPMLRSGFPRLRNHFPTLGNDFPRLRNHFPTLGTVSQGYETISQYWEIANQYWEMGDSGPKPPTIIKNAAPEMKTLLWGCFGGAQDSPAPVFLTKRRTWQPSCPLPSPVAADVRRLQLTSLPLKRAS